MSNFELTLLPKLDPSLSFKLYKLEPVLLLNSANTLYTDSVSEKRKVITGPYIETSALVRLETRKKDNRARPDKEVKTSVACVAEKKSSLTNRLNKVARADSKLKAKLDNKKEANFDFSANNEEKSTTWPNISARDDKKPKDEMRYLVAGPDKSAWNAG